MSLQESERSDRQTLAIRKTAGAIAQIRHPRAIVLKFQNAIEGRLID
jgi:hypothetical protein